MEMVLHWKLREAEGVVYYPQCDEKINQVPFTWMGIMHEM
jgi:hypothetical protein